MIAYLEHCLKGKRKKVKCKRDDIWNGISDEVRFVLLFSRALSLTSVKTKTKRKITGKVTPKDGESETWQLNCFSAFHLERL